MLKQLISCIFTLCLALGITTCSLAAEWELVSSYRDVRMVYISPEGISDKHYVAQVLDKVVVDKEECLRVFIFDDRDHIPMSLPMTNDQLLHWRAKYRCNPHAGIERFVYIKIIKASYSPPLLKEVQADIRPGHAK